MAVAKTFAENGDNQYRKVSKTKHNFHQKEIFEKKQIPKITLF